MTSRAGLRWPPRLPAGSCPSMVSSRELQRDSRMAFARSDDGSKNGVMTLEWGAIEKWRGRVRGCLLGGAIGDALGAPIEFWSLDQIRAAVGADDVRDYLPCNDGSATSYGLVTDDTQLTLFTVEGLIRANVRRFDHGLGHFTLGVVHAAYDRWLDTQIGTSERDWVYPGWLMRQSWLHASRAPGSTCLSALGRRRLGNGGAGNSYGDPAENDSKGCGTVMRSAPFGLLPSEFTYVADGHVQPWRFEAAATAAGFTHGHPTAQLASGTLAEIISGLVAGASLDAALDAATAVLSTCPANEETTHALLRARQAARKPPRAETVEELGAGWIAEEALAIAVYAALSHPGRDEILDALALSVTHSGDSDSTGSICGNILGTLHGDAALPPTLAFEVEGRGTILELADDFVWEFTDARQERHGEYGPMTRWHQRYPPN
jgi:ADP-ribosylglycohydrolase